MYSPFRLALKYIRYYITAANGHGHGIHSPFVFQFVKQVLNDRKNYPEYHLVETLRLQVLNDHSTLTVADHGAGSSQSSGPVRKISSIAKNAAKPKKYAQLLFRMARVYQPAQILELGTSLGLTTAYLALANKNAKTISIEGSPEIAEKAKENLRNLSLQEVIVMTGEFSSQLGSVLKVITDPCLIFVDGNHRMQPTIEYFEKLLPLMKDGSAMVFDDIHWSSEMEMAWEKIKSHPDVCLTIDLFFIGIVFFRSEFQIKQHFTIRY